MILYILRGVPGCGKSTLAKTLAPPEHICESDDYHMVDGAYIFDFKKLGEAHIACREKVTGLMESKAPKIVVANTNITSSDVETYRRMADIFGYTSFVIVVENRHEGVDNHNVPEDTLVSMEQKLSRSIKLR